MNSKTYLNQSSSSNLNTSPQLRYNVAGMTPQAAPAPATAAATGSTTSQGATNDYSTTNIQVAGVDEADKVKTDGQYIYV